MTGLHWGILATGLIIACFRPPTAEASDGAADDAGLADDAEASAATDGADDA